MAKVIDSCRSCGFLAYDLGFKPFCGETGTYIDDIYNGIPADCPLPDAPDATSVKQLEANCRWLIARIDEIHAAAYPGKTGTWQERAEQAVEAVKKLRTEIDDEYALYESLSEMHEAAKKDWWAEREKLQAENDRLREVLKVIRDYGADGDRSEDGYPAEIAYDKFAYYRIVDSYREAAKQALEDTE